MEELKERLDNELETLFAELKECEPSSPEYGKLVSQIDKLSRTRIEVEEQSRKAAADWEKIKAESSKQESDQAQRKQQKILEITKVVAGIGTTILTAGFIGWQTKAILNTEEYAPVNSKVFNIMPKMKLGK